MLRRTSIKLVKVSGGDEALTIAMVFRPNLMVVGDSLPDMAVAEFCRRVRDHGGLSATKLLLVTEEVAVGGGATGLMSVDGHLIAPVEPEQLSQSVGALLALPVRRSHRVEVELLATVSGIAEENPDEADSANIVNLSAEGARLEAEGHLRVGAKGTISFYLPRTKQALELSCVVRGVIDELALHYGVEFISLGTAQKQALLAYVASRQQEPGSG